MRKKTREGESRMREKKRETVRVEGRVVRQWEKRGSDRVSRMREETD